MKAASLVYAVDDDASVRRSLTRALGVANYRVQAFGTAGALLAALARTPPDCLIVDVGLPDLDGLQLQQRLADENCDIPIVFITGHGDIPMSVRAMKAGAVNFLTKPFGVGELINSVREALHVRARAEKAAATRAAARKRLAALSAREMQVLRTLAAGRLNKQAATDLGITERTVKFHRAALFRKLGVKGLAEAVTLLHA